MPGCVPESRSNAMAVVVLMMLLMGCFFLRGVVASLVLVVVVVVVVVEAWEASMVAEGTRPHTPGSACNTSEASAPFGMPLLPEVKLPERTRESSTSKLPRS